MQALERKLQALERQRRLGAGARAAEASWLKRSSEPAGARANLQALERIAISCFKTGRFLA
ncbi:hypothetical protein Pyn_00816 [Prunus yedoensis var. nudiflora]|uniref:Uncharacterized protein n=1 Tax=Prunus yedoensis var. nudiflora TaxID=2094558 RepID=A0A314ZBY6_PRUYE|nr:hypothetical protein Pyn_00816 [Prunus yedoensis var. nudiflora]